MSFSEEGKVILKGKWKKNEIYEKISLNLEEFEKDNDENHHIDFICAMSNCRAENYSLEKISWI